MKAKKRIVPILVAVLMVFALIPATVYAETKTYDCGDDMTYTLDDDGTFTVSGNGPMMNYYLYNQRPWHEDCDSIKKVVINPGVTTIGAAAFKECHNLEAIDIPEGVTRIENSAFSNTQRLKSIIIPSSVSYIGMTAFEYCYDLDSITINRADETPIDIEIYAFLYVYPRQATIVWTGDELPEGAYIEYGVVPEDAGYSVSGNTLSWDESIPNEVQLTTTIAMHKYEITFINDDGTVLQSSQIAYGETPSYNGQTPTKPADAQYTYTFAGWDPEISEVTGDATYKAKYTSEAKPKPEPTPTKVSGTLLAKITAKGKSSLVLTWSKVKGADGYDVFFAKCGANISAKKVKTIKGNKTFKWTKKGLKAKKGYKAVVKAYTIKNGKKTYVRTSPMVHAYTSGGTSKYTNAKSVTVKKASVSLKAGKTYKIKANVVKLQKGKKLVPTSHAPKLRYVSSNKKIATVSKTGKITAKAKGSCKVYVIAVNGASKAVSVTVK